MNLTRCLIFFLLYTILPAMAATNLPISYKQMVTKLNVMPSGNSGGWIESLYDDHGNLTEERKFDSNKNLLEKFEYSYDTNNNRIHATYFNCFGWLCSREDFTFDQKGNILSESRYFNGTLIGQSFNPGKKPNIKVTTNVTLNDRMEYVYDKKGNRVKTVKINYAGDIYFIDEVRYKNNGKLMVQTRSLSGKELSRTESKYDASGSKTEEISYSSNNIKVQRSVFVNEKDGKMIRQTITSPLGFLLETRTYNYDEHKNIIGMSAFDDKGQKTGSIARVYDHKNRCIEMNEYNGMGGAVRKQSWQYDDKGYMTQDVVYLFKNGIPILIQNIEYSYTY